MEYDVAAIVNDENAEYHRYLKRGEVRMQCCAGCGYVRYPARPFCPECLSESFAWKPLAGTGIVEAFIWYVTDLYDARYDSAWAWRDVPYNVTLVRLDGGPTLLSNVVGSRFGELQPGQAVTPVFVSISGEFGILRFATRHGG
jgi:hypothetical protein